MPEYANWYTFVAPIDDVIQGIWGDYDNTLLIATTYNIFRSTDQGKNWQQVDQQQTSISGILLHNDTLFAMNGLVNKGDAQLLANAGKYSVDEGKSWKIYRQYNPFFDTKPPLNQINRQLFINKVTASNDTVYAINQVFSDDVTNAIRRFNTPGVITSTGRSINLPQQHQIRSLYIDSKNRLYLTATDVICGRGNASEGFLFCNSKNGRGVVYISKQSTP